MNVETGHLVSDINDVEEPLRDQYERIPAELEEDATRELAGKREVHVALARRDSKLSKWARKRRADKKRRRNAIAKASRRRNRRK